MKQTKVVSIVLPTVLLVAAGVGGWFVYGMLQDLEAEVGGLRSTVADLQEDLVQAEERAEASRERADAADARAAKAEDLSDRLAERAREAEEQARTAEERAESALGEAQAARTQAAEESEARRRAEEETEQAILDAVRAEQKAHEARQRLQQVREQRERELNRLERSLGRIAETRRTALGMVMNLGDSIEFDFDQAELRPKNRELLSRIAGVLLTTENFSIQVYGHTDDVGSVEYNQELSERRAAAVREYLVEAGVDPERIQSKGFGKAAPLVEGTSPEARQRNRRVEIAVVQTSGSLPEDFVAEEPEGDADEGSSEDDPDRP
jgi:outer membrane protein OmpA-like peptidoglycan-associated protein